MGKADSAVQDVSGKEDKSNKVTSISSSSTNTQYPGAKLVYDELKEKQDEIDALVEENTTLKAQIPTGHKKVSSITLTDASEGLPIENVAIWGATSQDSYNGYNIFNINEISNSSSNGISLSVNGNNITLSGTATAGAFIIFNLTNPISLSNGDSLTLSKTAVAEVTGQTILRDASNNSIVKLNHNALSTTYTATADITLTKLVFYVSNGVTINYTFKLQIENGSTVHDWEPYVGGTSSPNKEYPQTIHKVTGNNNVKGQNKNLFDGQLENGTLISGETSSNSNLRRSKNYTKIKPNTNYVFSINGTANRVVANFYDENKNWIEQGGNVGLLSTTGIFTSPANAEYFKFRGYQDDTALLSSGNIMLEENSTATDYIAHAEQNAPLTLEDIELYDGDKIQISYVNKAGYKKVTGANAIKKCNEYTFDGSIAGDYTFKDDNTNTISVNLYPNQIDQGILKGTNGIPVYCSDFIYINDLSDTEHLYVTAATPITGGWKGNTRIYINKTRLTGYSSSLTNAQKLNLFKTYLTQNPITIVYKSVQSTTTPITDTTLLAQLETLINLKTYKEVTHIDATGEDLAPVLEFNYYKDMTTIFDNLEARVELSEN